MTQLSSCIAVHQDEKAVLACAAFTAHDRMPWYLDMLPAVHLDSAHETAVMTGTAGIGLGTFSWFMTLSPQGWLKHRRLRGCTSWRVSCPDQTLTRWRAFERPSPWLVHDVALSTHSAPARTSSSGSQEALQTSADIAKDGTTLYIFDTFALASAFLGHDRLLQHLDKRCFTACVYC